MLADARNNKLEKLNQLSDYEQTVKNAIKRAEMEVDDDDDENEKDEKKKGILSTVGSWVMGK